MTTTLEYVKGCACLYVYRLCVLSEILSAQAKPPFSSGQFGRQARGAASRGLNPFSFDNRYASLVFLWQSLLPASLSLERLRKPRRGDHQTVTLILWPILAISVHSEEAALEAV